MSISKDFEKERERLNNKVLKNADKNTQKFFSLDLNTYQKSGALDVKTKHLMGMAASLSHRCEDCVRYHIIEAVNCGANKEEIFEAFSIALMVGGSIVTPFLRRAVNFLEEVEVLKVTSKLNVEIMHIINDKTSKNEKLKKISEILAKSNINYSWVGFYLIKEADTLALGPFYGEDTKYPEVKFGEGLCGQVALYKRTFVVPDTSLEPKYLPGVTLTKSSVVIPIFNSRKFFEGVFVIDSYVIDPFIDVEIKFLEDLCEKIGQLY
jgi:AhpD family alkylhydroperoxidase